MPPKSKTPKKKESGKQTPVVEEKFQQVDISTKDPRTVALMLDSPEPVIVCRACEALQKHVAKGDENCTELKEIGVVLNLVKLLSSTDKAVRSYAVLCLASMATNSSVRGVLLRCECVAPLLALLQPDEELISQERASFTLAQIAVEYSFKSQLHHNSAHDPLLKMLASSDPDVQRNCAQALSLLAENYQCRPSILDSGGLPAILELLKSEFAIIQELALKTLHSCMHHAGCRREVLSGDGLEKLVAFLGEKECSDLHALGVDVLALCLEEAESVVALQNSGCLQQLLSNITESSNPDMKRNSAKALAKATQDTVSLKILHEQEVEKTFLSLLSNEDDGVVTAGCDGITAMSALNSSQQMIGQLEDGLSTLLQSTERERDYVRVAAVHALAAVISGSPANCKSLGSCGGSEALVRLLTDSESGCREFASSCITSMAPDSSLRNDLISDGAIQALVQCLTFADSAVQSGACEALGMLACDSNARQELSTCEDGVSALLSLVHSPVDSVVQNAVWTISVCAQSADLSELICRLGGLELVGKMSSTGHAHKSMAKAALNKLLVTNLSAKYWTTGHLSQNDVMTDTEFFDAGLLLSTSHPFTPLSELVNKPLNKNQPILTVNLLTKATPPSADNERGDPANQLETSQSTVSTVAAGSGRSKSRQQGGTAEKGKSKRGRNERESESRISEASVESTKPSSQSATQLGLLPLDMGLWTHITHARNHIQCLSSAREQVIELAKYVSEQLGGVVKRSGSLGYELPAGEIQYSHQSNLLPLGEVTQGSFQHRALLFKVLCDQLGIGCSLTRGEYGRHWNDVWLANDSQKVAQYVVDLTFEPGTLLLANTTGAVQYQQL